jgi:anti-anti-sigma factor
VLIVYLIKDTRVQLERSESTCSIKVTDDPIFREFNFSRIILDRLIETDKHVILDLSMVSSLHSPGLANLVSIHVSLQKRGKTLELIGINDTNRRLLRATNLDRLLKITE